MPQPEFRRGQQYVPVLLIFCALGLALVFGLQGARLKPQAIGKLAKRFFPPEPSPAPPWKRQDLRSLRKVLDQGFASLLASKHNGFVLLAADGKLLYDHNGAADLTPASTLKILTGATALRVLGAQYRFITRIASLDPIQDGVLDGDLYIVGGGDPVLSSDDLRKGVGSLYDMGLRKIMGHVVVDTSAFVGPEQNPHWAPDDLNLDYAAGTSALSLDGDIEVFHVTAGKPGSAALVRLEPANDEARLQGTVLSVPPAGGEHVRIAHVSGRNEYLLSGQLVSGSDQRYPIPVGNVGQQVGGVIDTLLQHRGIAVVTPARVDAAPLGAQILWRFESHSLREIVHHMLVVSDNHFAEQLLRTIAAATGHQGTESEGIGVEQALLKKLMSTDRGMHLYDGSGLSPADRIAPRALARVIADASSTPGSTFIQSLPRVGIEGTVRAHTLKAAYGRVRAKSGHIAGVDGLAGVIQTRHHGTLAFAFIANDADDTTVENAEDAVFDKLAEY